MASHVMQGKAGFMFADELWVELPGYPSSWVSLAFTFYSLQHPATLPAPGTPPCWAAAISGLHLA